MSKAHSNVSCKVGLINGRRVIGISACILPFYMIYFELADFCPQEIFCPLQIMLSICLRAVTWFKK